MSMKPSRRTAIAIVIGLTITTAWVGLDGRIRDSRARDFWNMFGIQWGDQAQALVMSTRARFGALGQEDALKWVADRLSQVSQEAAKNRKIRVSTFQKDVASESISIQVDRRAGYFELERIVIPEEGAGIRFQVDLPPEGYLGIQSKLGEDFAILLTAGLFCFVSFFFISRKRFKALEPVMPAQNSPKEQVSLNAPAPVSGAWLDQAKALLSEAGKSIREIIKAAHDLTVAAATTREWIEKSRSRLHVQIDSLGTCKDRINEVVANTTQAEAYSLNLVIEANRMGERGAQIGAQAQKLHEVSQNIRRRTEEMQAIVNQVERTLEPMVMDADQAANSFESVFEVARRLDDPIKKTGETLLSQAKWIQEARKSAAIK